MTLKALIVDDSRIMRNMVIRALNRSGLAQFEFVEAGDGAEALALFDKESIDIDLVDWNMPNMTGIEFVRQIRAEGNTEHIPFIMVTSEKSMGKIEEALDQACASAFICKPFTDEEIAQRLKKLVDGVVARKTQPEASGGGGGWLSRMFS